MLTEIALQSMQINFRKNIRKKSGSNGNGRMSGEEGDCSKQKRKSEGYLGKGKPGRKEVQGRKDKLQGKGVAVKNILINQRKGAKIAEEQSHEILIHPWSGGGGKWPTKGRKMR